MKKNYFVMGMLALLLTFSLTFIGCDEDNGGNGNGEFTVTFDLEGGKVNGNTANVTRTVKSGETVSDMPTATKDDYDFAGWFSQKNGAGSAFTSSTAVTSNITVYANWTPQGSFSPLEGLWYITVIDDDDDFEYICFWKFSGDQFLMGIVTGDIDISQIDFNFDDYLDGAAKGTFTYTETELELTAEAYWDGDWIFDSIYLQPPHVPCTLEYSITNNILTLDGDGLILEDCGIVSGSFIKFGTIVNNDPKSIKITGLTEKSGEVMIGLFSSNFEELVASGRAVIEGDSATFSLMNGNIFDIDYIDEGEWIGTGSFIIQFGGFDNEEYVFTDGKEFSELGIFTWEDMDKIPIYNIVKTISEIDFSKFRPGDFEN